MTDENKKEATTQQAGAEKTTTTQAAGFSKEEKKRTSTPPYFVASRQLSLCSTQLEKQVKQLNLFTDRIDYKDGIKIMFNENITDVDFYAVKRALAIILYNQSYLYGNEKELSGIAKLQVNVKGTIRFKGTIEASISDIAKYGYGDNHPTTKRREKIEFLLNTFSAEPFRIVYSNGDEDKLKLCTWMYAKKRGKSLIYSLDLNPIFCDLGKGYNKGLQENSKLMLKETKRLTGAHYLFLELIERQQGNFSRYIDTLAEELNLIKVYKINRSRAERKIIELCEIAVKCGVIKKYVPTRDIKTKKLTQVTFIKDEKKLS